MLSKLLQPSKKYAPNEVILEGSLTFFNLEQSAKTNAPNEVIHDKSMFVKLLQPLKQPVPNEVNFFGKEILDKLLQLANLLLVDYQYYTL